MPPTPTVFKAANLGTDNSPKGATPTRKDVFPWMGKRPIKDIAAPELLATLRVWKAGERRNSPHRICEYYEMVFLCC